MGARDRKAGAGREGPSVCPPPTHIHPQGAWSDGETWSSGFCGFSTLDKNDTGPTLRSFRSDGSKWSILGKAERGFFFFFFLMAILAACGRVPGLGVELELHLPACATATAMPDLSHICNLCHNLWQRQIPNPLSEARGQTRMLMNTMLGS